MERAATYPVRRVSCLVLTLLLAAKSVMTQSVDAVRTRTSELHAKGSDVQVSLKDGTSIRGRIVRVEPDSFALLQNSAGEVVVPFAKVANVRKQGDGSRKALWIPLAIGGGVLLVLCVAPYPIGFLCRSDPS